jgi:hypothetical protein
MVGNIFNVNQGQISFYLKSRYSFAQRLSLSGARYAFDVQDGSSDLFHFATYTSSGYLVLSYMVNGSSQFFIIPPGTEDALFGNGVILKVTIRWGTGVSSLYLNDVLATSASYATPSPNWTAASIFDLGAINYFGSGVGFNVSDDIIDEFTVAGPLIVPDTAPPTVSFVTPANGATLTGSITLSANATDNVGIAGVQFNLDGSALGPRMTGTGPLYSLSWDTTTATNGSHTISLAASDATGNIGMASITVSVSNAPGISNIQGSSVTSSSATITWTTDVNADSQVEYGTSTAYGLSSALQSTLSTSHSVALSGLTAATVYHYRVKSKNSSGILTVSSDNTLTTLGGSSGPVRIQSKGAVRSYGTSLAVTFTNPTTSGNQLIVAVADYYATGSAPYSISDSKGNTWKTAIDYANGAHILVFYSENIVGGSGETVTVTTANPAYFSVTVVEYAGLATSNSLDVTAMNRATSANYTSSAATIAAGNELLLGVHHVWGTSVTFIPAVGWSTVGLQVGYDEVQVQDQIVGAAGSYASTGTESSSNDTLSVLVAFKGR